ncbi:MAG: NAD(P)H-dependent oxidoreductase [Oscillospiraceae bacterium]|nr:NAD(P)H-dependent oxidoreductase [Oscillospiraceae bacterium]
MENKVLYINACVRSGSRTKRLAEKLLERIGEPFEEIRTEELSFPKADEEFLLRRERLISEGKTADPIFEQARRFSEAETIVIAAPYWDLSFPASLKRYLEQVNAVGITFRYSEEGIPEGLCRAKRLFYVCTAGGYFAPDTFGFEYVKALAQSYYGIEDVRLIKAAGLDIDGADVNGIMRETEQSISEMDIG